MHIIIHTYVLLIDACSCSDHSGRCVMAAVSGFPPPEQWSSCSRTNIQTALTRANNRLGRCLENEPISTIGDPVCGNGIREGNEICDCGSPQVRRNELVISLHREIDKTSCNFRCTCTYRSAQIAAVMPGLVDWQPVLNAVEESAALAHASLSLMEPRVGVLADSVTFKNTAVAGHQSAQLMSTNRTALLATTPRPIATQENVKLTTNSASITLDQVK